MIYSERWLYRYSIEEVSKFIDYRCCDGVETDYSMLLGIMCIKENDGCRYAIQDELTCLWFLTSRFLYIFCVYI